MANNLVQISRDLPTKQGELEANIKDLGQLEEQLNHLLLWLSPIRNQLEILNQPNQRGPFDIKETEVAVQAKQPDVEGILSKGQHLYKEKPATEPVKAGPAARDATHRTKAQIRDPARRGRQCSRLPAGPGPWICDLAREQSSGEGREPRLQRREGAEG
ncbi:Dystrophin [Myotis brandtii]|uniref:Dystrophin n=1 Tax=Myotis brandtii TaxID=109478 RepID=S7QD29_MYOBR|nr:Dystrophin [Myotis brandtii]